MKVGDKVRIAKKTFLHKGVLVHTNSLVEIVDVSSTSATVAYVDREGGVHHIQLNFDELGPGPENAS